MHGQQPDMRPLVFHHHEEQPSRVPPLLPRKTVIPEQLHILQHSLGCDEYGVSTSRYPGNDGPYFRNHYVAPADADLTTLLDMGYLTIRAGNALSGDSPIWFVTKAGIAAMRAESPARPKVSRSKQRYHDFLHADLNCSFTEYLKNGWYKPVDRYSTPS